jgi:hypothetical protein
MTQRIRVRCPHCGMMSDLEHFKDGPYDVQVFLQTFGGKVPGDRKGKGSGKGSGAGVMEYEEITKTAQGKKVLKEIGQ